jgi:hypothetical protein
MVHAVDNTRPYSIQLQRQCATVHDSLAVTCLLRERSVAVPLLLLTTTVGNPKDQHGTHAAGL